MTSITITDIKEAFSKVITYSQGIPNPKIDALFEDWYEAKRQFIEDWNGNFIYEFPEPVTFELAAEEKEERLNSFIAMLDEQYCNIDLINFIAFNKDSFFCNHLKKDYVMNNGDKIVKGTKFVKAFKYFEDDLATLTEIQNQASMIIQEDKVSGTLCLSVHPLDFLSASENTYQWRSCHALDGDYRVGNLSYMVDKSTVICYLKNGDKKVKLPRFPEDVPWNSKKWRMFLFLSDEKNAMFAGRQYPFFSETALTLVKRVAITSLRLPYGMWSKWYNDYIRSMPNRQEIAERMSDADLYGRHVCLSHKIYCINDLVTDAPGSMHYNDLLESTCYTPYYCWNRYECDGKVLHFSIGGATNCLHCGSDTITLYGTMRCKECEERFGEGETEDFTYCACCNRRVYRDDMYWVNGTIQDYLCYDCYHEETRTCEVCGDRYYTCDIIYNSTTQEYVCPYCNETIKNAELTKKLWRID